MPSLFSPVRTNAHIHTHQTDTKLNFVLSLLLTCSPKYRGKYCLGERRRYKICNIPACGQGEPTFRHVQCSHFNALPYKGKFYKWETVFNRGEQAKLGALMLSFLPVMVIIVSGHVCP